MKPVLFYVSAILMLTTIMVAQPGTTYIWTPVSNNFWNPLNWTPNGVPDSSDTAVLSNSATIFECLIDPERKVRNFVVPAGAGVDVQGNGGSLYVADSLRIWGSSFSAITITSPDSGFIKIFSPDEVIALADSAKIVSRGVVEWHGGEITCPDNSGAGWINHGQLTLLIPEYDGGFSMWASFLNTAGGTVVKMRPETVAFRNGSGNTFENYGHIDIQSGSIWLQATSTLSGTVAISDSGDLTLNGNNNISVADVTVTGPNALRISGSTNFFSGNNTIDKLYFDGGEMSGDGSGVITVNDSLVLKNTAAIANISRLTIPEQSVLQMTSSLQTNSALTLDLKGETIIAPDAQMGGSWDATILNNGYMQIEHSQPTDIHPVGACQFINDSSGTVKIEIPQGNSARFSPGNFINDGTITLDSGILILQTSGSSNSGVWNLAKKTEVRMESGSINWYQNSLINGSGRIYSANTGINFWGEIQPGGGAGYDTLTIDCFYPVTLASTSHLIFELDHSGRDIIFVNSQSQTTLAGSISVHITPEFTAAAGDTLDLMLFESELPTGAFADTLLPDRGDWEIVFADSAISLVAKETITSLDPATNGENLPSAIELLQNFPNPFNSSTTIAYSLPATGRASLKIFDIAGREVANLLNKSQIKGQHTVSFEARNLPSGVYFYELTAGGHTRVKKMLLIR